MYRVTSHQVCDLFFPGPARSNPEKGGVHLRMGLNEYAILPPSVLGRFEVFEADGLATIEIIDDTAVAS